MTLVVPVAERADGSSRRRVLLSVWWVSTLRSGWGRGFLIPRKYLACPRNGVGDAYPRRLRTRPQLQVLGPVVVFDAIAMMNVLSWQEIPAEHLLHDTNVLKDIVPVVCPWVPRRPGHEIALLVPCPAAPPVAVGGPAVIAASPTGNRMHLLRCPARAEIA